MRFNKKQLSDTISGPTSSIGKIPTKLSP